MLRDTQTPEPPWRVLVWPGGTEIGLEIRRALRDLKEIELFGAGSANDVRGSMSYQNWLSIPDVTTGDWLDPLKLALAENRIDFIFPAHDDVLTAAAAVREALSAILIAPSTETCELLRSKRQTYEALKHVVPVPRVLDPREPQTFPIFAKPDRGQGSRGARRVTSERELSLALASGADLVTEYLPGPEVTVDCFSSRKDGLIFSRARSRQSIRSGISGHSRDLPDQEPYTEIASRIATELGLSGPWFFQLREDPQGQPTLMEVGPRVAGTMALHRAQGINFPLLALYDAIGEPVTIMTNDLDLTIDRPLSNNYLLSLEFDTVYCDLDDMLIVRGQVNIRLVALLYQFLNEQKRLVLLTRHRRDVQATLATYRLSEIFDDVIVVADNEEKADHIATTNSILIDDSFRERKAAAIRLGIATFDSSNLEALLKDEA